MNFKQYFLEKNDDSEDEIMGQLIDLFSSKEKVVDKDIHALADSLGIDPHSFEDRVYSLLSSFFNAGNFKKNPSEDVDEDELKMGIKVEMEHTNSEAISRRIALDHLSELPDYYTRLAKMEKS